MKEKILLKLKEKREKNSPVSDRTLNDIATTLSNLITTDEQLEAFDVTTVLATIGGNISHTASESVKEHQRQLQEAEEKKKQEEVKQKELEDKIKAAGNGTGTDDKVPAYVSEIMKQNQLLTESLKSINDQILSLKTEKVASTRTEQLEKTLKNVPEWYASTIKLGFNPDSFKDEDSFNNYIEGVKKNTDTFLQQAKENGLNIVTPSGQTKKIIDDGTTPEFSDALKIVEEYKQKQKENATN